MLRLSLLDGGELGGGVAAERPQMTRAGALCLTRSPSPSCAHHHPRPVLHRGGREFQRRICSIVHWRGALSGRQRTSRVPCRKRPPVTWSKATSTTSSGFRG